MLSISNVGGMFLGKLMFLYNVMDRAKKMNGVKTDVEVKVNYNNKILNRKFVTNFDGNNTSGKKGGKKQSKRRKILSYAMMFSDILNRVNINEGETKKLISLKIDDFDKLPVESKEIIQDFMQSSRGLKDKLSFVTDMKANGSSTSEIMSMVKEVKKLDLQIKEIELKSLNVELEVDKNLNMNRLKFYGEGVHIEGRRPVAIGLNQVFTLSK